MKHHLCGIMTCVGVLFLFWYSGVDLSRGARNVDIPLILSALAYLMGFYVSKLP